MQGAGFLTFITRWASVPGVSIPNFLRLDVMHIKDLGTSARFVGTAMTRMIEGGVYEGSSKNEKLQGLVDDLAEWYKEVSCVNLHMLPHMLESMCPSYI